MEGSGAKNFIIFILVVIVVGLTATIISDKNVDTEENADNEEEPSFFESILGGEDEEESDEDEEGTKSSTEPNQVTTPPPAPTAAKTPAPAPTPTPTVTPVGTPLADSQDLAQKKAVIVTYTDNGFIPPVVEVRAGGDVIFINSSGKPMWVTSENHPTAKAQYYPSFDQGKSSAIGETYTFQFTRIGVWGYKNLNDDKHLGAVSVIEQ